MTKKLRVLMLTGIFVLSIFSYVHAANPVDEVVRTFVLHNRSSFLDRPMDHISLIADKNFVLPLFLLLPDGEFRDDSLKAVGFTVLVTTGLKYAVGRIRPHDYEDGGKSFAPFTDLNSSMPSGHAAGMFAFARVCAEHYPEHKEQIYLLAVLVAYSRIYKDRHWFTDVIAGGAVGYFSAQYTLCRF